MDRKESHLAIFPEQVLRAVAVMHVPVEDSHPLGAMTFLSVARGYGRVVEEAEAHRPDAFGMMPRWTHGDESVGGPAGHHLVHGHHGTACSP